MENLPQAAKLVIKLGSAIPRKLARQRGIAGIFPVVSHHDICVDLGTGYGSIIRRFSERGSWTYVDIDPQPLSIAKLFLQGEFVIADAVDYLHQKTNLSLITAFDSLIYFSNLSEILSAISQALKPGGWFVVSGRNFLPTDLLFRLRRKLGLEHAIGNVSNPTANQMSLLLKQNNFRILKQKSYSGPFVEWSQMFIDIASLQKGKEGDRLTSKFTPDDTELFWKFKLSEFLTGFSKTLNVLDELVPFFPRYGYVIVAQRE